MKKKIKILLILLLIIVIALVVYRFNKIAIWLYPTNIDRNAELLKIILSVFAGVGVFIGLIVSLKRARTTEKSVILQSKAIDKQGEQIQLATKSQIDERFSNAIEHLGSEKEPVLLGGIAELHQIAKENRKDYAEVVFKILCSYIRSSTNIYNKNADDFNNTAIQTIIDYLFKPPVESENPYKNFNADLSHSNLLATDLNGCDFSFADFSFCLMPSLENVILKSANIGKTKFSVATLCNVNLTNAKVSNTSFHSSHLENVTFQNCLEILTIHFIFSELKNVNFENTKIYKSSFLTSFLSNVSFNNSGVQDTTFACSILSNVSFITKTAMYKLDFRATGLTDVNFTAFISDSKFNGCDNYFSKYRPDLEDRFKQRINQKADVSLLNFSGKSFSECDIGILTQKDIDEIKEIFDRQNS